MCGERRKSWVGVVRVGIERRAAQGKKWQELSRNFYVFIKLCVVGRIRHLGLVEAISRRRPAVEAVYLCEIGIKFYYRTMKYGLRERKS